MKPCLRSVRPGGRARRLLALSLGAAGAAVALAGCGGDGGASASTADVDQADLQVLARDNEFDRDRYELPAGTSTIGYIQEGAVRHNLLIEGPGGGDVPGFELEVYGHETDAGSVELEPGTYTLYCGVAGHREDGMEADLEVGP